MSVAGKKSNHFNCHWGSKTWKQGAFLMDGLYQHIYCYKQHLFCCWVSQAWGEYRNKKKLAAWLAASWIQIPCGQFFSCACILLMLNLNSAVWSLRYCISNAKQTYQRNGLNDCNEFVTTRCKGSISCRTCPIRTSCNEYICNSLT